MPEQRSKADSTKIAGIVNKGTLVVVMPLPASSNSSSNDLFAVPEVKLNDILLARYRSPAITQMPYLLFELPQNTIWNCYINLALIQREVQSNKEQKCLETDQDQNRHDEAWRSRLTAEERYFQNQTHASSLKRYEDLRTVQQPIELNALWSIPEPAQQTTTTSTSNQYTRHGSRTCARLVIEGAAGVGKSTLCRYIVAHWSQTIMETSTSESLLASDPLSTWRQRFKVIVYLPLRALADIKAEPENENQLPMQYVINFLKRQYRELRAFSDDQLKSLLQELEQRDAILYLLDGFDEVVHFCTEAIDSVPTQRSVILETLINKKTCLITTRPHVASHVALSNATRLEIVGFTPTHQLAYIDQFFKALEKPALIGPMQQWVQRRAELRGLTTIPVNLELLCSLARDNRLNLAKTELITLTTIYEQMLLGLVRRYLMKINTEGTEGEERLGALDDEERVAECQSELINLSELAWRAMSEKKLTVQSQSIKTVLKALPAKERAKHAKHILKEFGLLSSIGIGKKDLMDQDYYFLHLTFQEFLAACYAAQCLLQVVSRGEDNPAATNPKTQEQIQAQDAVLTFIKTHAQDPLYEMVWQFTAGLLGEDSNIVWDLANLPGKQAAIRHKALNQLFACLIPEEVIFNSDISSLYDAVLHEWDIIMNPRKRERGIYDYVRAINRSIRIGLICLEEIKYPQVLKSYKNYIQMVVQFWRALLEVEKYEAGSVFQYEARYDIILYQLPQLLNQSDVKALWEEWLTGANLQETINISMIGFFQCTPTIYIENALEAACKNSSDQIREEAARTIGQLGHYASEKLKQCLVELLRDSNLQVQNSVVNAIEFLSACVTAELKQQLIKLSCDHNWEVRAALACAIKSLSSNATDELQSCLTKLLGDEAATVRAYAADAIGHFGSSATKEQQLCLVELLCDNESNVRAVAARAIGSLSSNVAKECQLCLVELLHDGSYLVRSAVVPVIRSLGSSATEKFRQRLVELSYDDNLNIRAAVACAMGSLGSYLEAKHQLRLVELSRDPVADVRAAIARGIKSLGSSATSELQLCLVEQLRDDNCRVREAAAHALRDFGLDAAEELLQHLIELLRDDIPEIRNSVVDVIHNMKMNASQESKIETELRMFETSSKCELRYLGYLATTIIDRRAIDIKQNSNPHQSEVVAKTTQLLDTAKAAQKMGDTDSFITNSELALRSIPLPNVVFKNDTVCIRHQLVVCYFKQGKVELAIKTIKEGLLLETTNPLLKVDEGLIRFRQGELEQAICIFEHIQKRYRGNNKLNYTTFEACLLDPHLQQTIENNDQHAIEINVQNMISYQLILCYHPRNDIDKIQAEIAALKSRVGRYRPALHRQLLSYVERLAEAVTYPEPQENNNISLAINTLEGTLPSSHHVPLEHSMPLKINLEDTSTLRRNQHGTQSIEEDGKTLPSIGTNAPISENITTAATSTQTTSAPLRSSIGQTLLPPPTQGYCLASDELETQAIQASLAEQALSIGRVANEHETHSPQL